jgi:hypothetical protein
LANNLAKGETVTGYRICAAYCWHVLLDATAAKAFIKSAHAVADKYIIPGMIPLEKQLLNQLDEQISIEAVAG